MDAVRVNVVVYKENYDERFGMPFMLIFLVSALKGLLIDCSFASYDQEPNVHLNYYYF
jgi:hypothetical protein